MYSPPKSKKINPEDSSLYSPNDSSSKISKPTTKRPLTSLRQLLEQQLSCTISQQLFKDPVVTADGHTYQRKDIENWLLKSNKSPKSNLDLRSFELRPNILIKTILQILKEECFFQENTPNKSLSSTSSSEILQIRKKYDVEIENLRKRIEEHKKEILQLNNFINDVFDERERAVSQSKEEYHEKKQLPQVKKSTKLQKQTKLKDPTKNAAQMIKMPRNDYPQSWHNQSKNNNKPQPQSHYYGYNQNRQINTNMKSKQVPVQNYKTVYNNNPFGQRTQSFPEFNKFAKQSNNIFAPNYEKPMPQNIFKSSRQYKQEQKQMINSKREPIFEVLRYNKHSQAKSYPPYDQSDQSDDNSSSQESLQVKRNYRDYYYSKK